jgi:hypothetical protein
VARRAMEVEKCMMEEVNMNKLLIDDCDFRYQEGSSEAVDVEIHRKFNGE